MEKIIEHKTVTQRETTAAKKTNFIRGLDFMEGDYVQIAADGKPEAGKCGIILTVRIDNTGQRLIYTIKLSDTRSIDVVGSRLRFVRSGQEDKR